MYTLESTLCTFNNNISLKCAVRYVLITSREKPLAYVSKNAWEKSVTSEEKNPEDTGALA